MIKIKLIFVLITIAFITGCGSAPNPNVPKWAGEQPPTDVIWGIGSSNLINNTFSMQTAGNLAQNDVSQKVNAFVRQELYKHFNEAELAINPEAAAAFEGIERIITNLSISGLALDIREQVPDGTWWVRVSVKKDDVLRHINAVLNAN